MRKFTYFKTMLLALMLLVGSGSAWGQVNISTGNTVTENFSALGTSATATLPTGWKTDKNTTVRSIGTYSGALTATTILGGNSMSTTAGNGIYNFGAGVPASATDRAIGGLSSGSASKSVNVYVQLTNNGISSISNFSISYNVEKYRNGSNAAGFSIQMYYSTDGTTWTIAGSDFLTSFTADADNSGYTSAPGSIVSVSNKTLSQGLTVGSSIYLAWNYSVTSGTTTTNAQALGIDDVSITAVTNSAAATPTFSPAAGTYTSAQNVTLSSTTPSALIYYTTDGVTTPSSSSTLYTGAIALNSTATTTIQTIAYDASNANPSNVASAAYTINLNPTINSTPATLSAFNAVVGTPFSRTLTVSGTNLTADITAALDDATQFQVSPATVTQSSGTAAATTMTVTYNPTAAGSHTAHLTLSSGSSTPVTYSLSGTATWAPLTTPVAAAATSITNTSFTANWNAVSGATEYQLDVITKSGTKITEGFDSGTTVPTGWTFNTIDATYTSTGNYGVASPSIKFDATNDAITSPVYSLPATEMSFWLKGQTTTGVLLVEGWNGSSWVTIESLSNPSNTATIHLYNSSSTPALPSSITQFRFTYTKTTSNLAFDDFVYKNNYSENAITGSPFTGISGTSNTLTGLQRGTAYYFTVIAKNTNVTSSISNEITANTTNNSSTVADGLWSIASTWADATVPPSGADVVVNNIVVVDQNVTAASLTINSGNSLSINSGKQLTVSTTLTNNGALNLLSDGTNGTATILTPVTIGGTTGTFSVQQYLSSARNWYVSSPVSNALAPSGYTYYNYNETGSSWGSTVPSFTKGVGYIALPATAGSTLTFATQSGGTLNSGNVDIALTKSGTTKTGFNLIGNPYPAHLTWTQAFVDNNAALIEPTIWYRTNAGTVNSGGDAAWSFKTINASTGVASPSGTTAIIPPMQAFWVRAVSAGTLTLNSDLTLSHQSSNPLKAPAIANSDRQLLRLQVNNGTTTDEAVIYIDPNASNGFDRYDSPKFEDATTVTQIYTTAGTEKLVINGMNSLSLNTEIGLGFVPGNATSFSIRANEVSNLTSDVKVILKDNVTLAETDLTNGVNSYEFSPATTLNNRFSVIFRTTEAATGIPTTTNDANLLVYRNANNQIAVQVKGQLNDFYSLNVYNSVGQRLSSKQATAGITILEAPQSGVYFVTVKGNGINTTNKVVIN